ncbi:hypothetical protein G6O69_29360 [Pseudenhygromyxa sp. WMMC2535]|uniref:hypothetical protein n=1 Tax=Pseudenhygromyxa sp. WMMC2535 TaxID=2712867 RepID=UPI001553476D|nr:hypothetical protein [Pseudenhygromyxa sp. WMMC2535]NVB41972.1 hypothetical protein [Pseudenhygromyxa sp. WMMC2535]
MSTESSPRVAEELERVRALPAALVELDPEFEPEGCPAKLIDKLERAHAEALPGWYRAYLETLGRSFAQLRCYADMDLRPKTLIKWLKQVAWRSPRYLQIGLADADSEFHLFVDRGIEGDGVGLVSFESPPGPEGVGYVRPFASRFSTYLLSAHATRLIGDMPAAGTISARGSETGKLAQVAKHLRQAGAELHPLSGSWDQVFVGPRALALVTELGGQESVAVYLGCTTRDEWWAIAGKLEHEVGLKIGRGPA